MEVSDFVESKTHMSRIAQVIAEQVASMTEYVTIADKDNEIYYYDDKAKVWRDNAENLIWKIVATKYPTVKKSILNDVIHYIKGISLLPREKFQPPKGWISFNNQSLDAIHNYSQEFDTCKNYIINRYPVRYDRKAVCPQFARFLNQVLPDVEDRITLLEVMAMVLIPHYNFEKAVMFIGTSSANGKSTIMKILKKLFGPDNTVSISLQKLIYNRFMAQKLDNKLINLYADINDEKISDLDQFKLIVSGDSMTVERKNGHPYEIEPKAKHFFSTNTLPEIDEDNTAVYRRFIIIEFPKSFEDCKDLDLLDKLTTKEELEGIMYLLLRIAKRMVKTRRFTYEQTPDEIRMRWKNQSNAVFELINNSTQIVKYSDKRISRQEFYTEYIRFCHSKKYTIKSQSTVSKQVEKLGYQSQKSNGVRYWLGIGVPQQSEGQKSL